MTPPAKHDLSKLPLWAQKLIETLKMREREANEKVVQIVSGGTKSSRMSYRDYSSDGEKRVYLPNGIMLEVDLGLKGGRVDLHLPDQAGVLEVRTPNRNLVVRRGRLGPSSAVYEKHFAEEVRLILNDPEVVDVVAEERHAPLCGIGNRHPRDLRGLPGR